MITRQPTFSWGLALIIAIIGCGNTATGVVVASGTASDRSEASTDKLTTDPKPSRCELRLELPATIQNKAHFRAKVEIKNVGESEVTLTMPGDGSDCRWRTPIIGWSMLPADSKGLHPREPPRERGARCGNINRLKPDEVFTLEPGNKKDLIEWIGVPRNLSPGKYRVVFYYSNVPDLKWGGVPLGKHDVDAMRRLKNSTPIALVSNEIQLEVLE